MGVGEGETWGRRECAKPQAAGKELEDRSIGAYNDSVRSSLPEVKPLDAKSLHR